MKKIKNYILTACLFLVFACVSCGGQNSGSGKETTANDSSGAESRKAMGVEEGNQKNVPGYPSNQSNLNSDSTSRLHDDDTITKKPLKDKPHPQR